MIIYITRPSSKLGQARYLFYGNITLSNQARTLTEVVITPEPEKEDAGI